MNHRSWLNTALVLLSCAGNVVSPSGAISGEPALPPPRKSSSDKLTCGADVVLTEEGVLRGILVRPDGQPLAGVPVCVRGAGRFLAEVKTRQYGRFRITGLQGGVYQVHTGTASQTLRLWAPGTAPPSATALLHLVSDNTVVRGQGDRRIGLSSDAILLGAVVAAGVTVPILISNRRSDSPPGS